MLLHHRRRLRVDGLLWRDGVGELSLGGSHGVHAIAIAIGVDVTVICGASRV